APNLSVKRFDSAAGWHSRRTGGNDAARRPQAGRGERSMRTRTTRRNRWSGAVAIVGALSLVAACGGGAGDGKTPAAAPSTKPADQIAKEANLPAYVPIQYVEPDFPSVAGSTAGFSS